MTPDQERLLWAVHGLVQRLDEKHDALMERLESHEEADSVAHQRISSLEETRTEWKAYWVASVFLVTTLAGAVGWLVSTGIAHAK